MRTDTDRDIREQRVLANVLYRTSLQVVVDHYFVIVEISPDKYSVIEFFLICCSVLK